MISINSSSDSEGSLPDIPEDSTASVSSSKKKSQAGGQSLDLARLWKELDKKNQHLGVPSDLEPYGGWDLHMRGRRPLTHLDQDGNITLSKRKSQGKSIFGKPSKIRKLSSRVSSTVSTPRLGLRFLTPIKKTDCLLSSRTIPQNREASPRPYAYIDLTGDSGMTNEQPSSTTPENETQLEEVQIENSDMENPKVSDQQDSQEVQVEDYTEQQLEQPLLLELVEPEEEPAPVAQDILLPPEELQILQETDSPSQVNSEIEKQVEKEDPEIELESEKQVEQEKEVSSDKGRQNQDSQKGVDETSQKGLEQAEDTTQRDKEYEAQLHWILEATLCRFYSSTKKTDGPSSL